MKTNKLFILTGLAAIASTSCSQKENTSGQPAKPMNILYIMTDDHSFQTISAYDKRYIQTPNIDRIAIETLRDTDGGTGFMHESFHKDNPSDYTRSWFAWTNTLFGELIVKLQSEGKLKDLLG